MIKYYNMDTSPHHFFQTSKMSLSDDNIRPYGYDPAPNGVSLIYASSRYSMIPSDSTCRLRRNQPRNQLLLTIGKQQHQVGSYKEALLPDTISRYLLAVAIWFMHHVHIETIAGISKYVDMIQSAVSYRCLPAPEVTSKSQPKAAACDAPHQDATPLPVSEIQESCTESASAGSTANPLMDYTQDRMVTHIVALVHSWTRNAPAHTSSIFDGATRVTTQMFVSALYDLLHHLECEEDLLIYALCYVQRVRETGWVLARANLLRMLLAAVLTAIKYSEDVCISNSTFAHLCGLHGKDVNCLERRFLSLLHFELYVTTAEFDLMCSTIHDAAKSLPRVQPVS